MNVQAPNDQYRHLIQPNGTREQDASLPAPRGITPEEHYSSSRTSFNSSSSSLASSSKTIPISGSAMRRSDSELQLQESEMLAEQRDYCMYMRIVNGMSSSARQRQQQQRAAGWQNDSWSSNSCSSSSSIGDDSLANIIKTRHTPILEEGRFDQLKERYAAAAARYEQCSTSSSHHALVQQHDFNTMLRAAPNQGLPGSHADHANGDEPIFDLEM